MIRTLLGLPGVAMAAVLSACAGDTSPTPTDWTPTPTTSPRDCTYPEGPEEMTLDEPIFPYRWFDARHRDGRDARLVLRDVFCNDDPDIDWSPFDVLLFVSIPAW